ncbi:MAG: pentapeptide repeat-containing protein [Prevotellaceae bacterium]|nr:pentapeptide repeat-containing protein [Prevotellaceae bacterium]
MRLATCDNATCDLRQCDLRQCDLRQCDLRQCDVRHTIFNRTLALSHIAHRIVARRAPRSALSHIAHRTSHVGFQNFNPTRSIQLRPACAK